MIKKKKEYTKAGQDIVIIMLTLNKASSMGKVPTCRDPPKYAALSLEAKRLFPCYFQLEVRISFKIEIKLCINK